MSHEVFAISPLDGRYAGKVKGLSDYFSEAALMRYRLLVEVEWLVFLFNKAKLKGTKRLTKSELEMLEKMVKQFDGVAALRVKEIEKTTNHDVKAIEYYIKENIAGTSLEKYGEFVHFGCTSEDINNLSYALMLKHGVEKELLPVLSGVVLDLQGLAQKWLKVPMLSRTHGQPASPTTVGKEIMNFVARLARQIHLLENQDFLGKMNGAVGNYNAHIISYPDQDWDVLGRKFIESLGLKQNRFTPQIEPHDYVAEVCDNVKRINNIILDLDRDMWTYISFDYFKQKLKEGEVGSSTMPHKVNPIDFENSEGNLGLANAMFEHLAAKLPISRMQRDLSDSTVFRNLGVGIGYSVLAYKSTIRGLNKLELNAAKLEKDLDKNWAVLAEPIQMVMRRYGVEKPYEKLKELTRGKCVNQEVISEFVDKLEIPVEAKKRLKKLTPAGYVGLAVDLAKSFNNGK